MTPNEVAKRAEISKETLRYYESIGLVTPPQRLANGYRSYKPAVLDELRFIKLAQTAGFTLNEIKPAIPHLQQPVPQCPQLIAAIRAQIGRVDDKIDELQAARALLNRWLDKLMN